MKRKARRVNANPTRRKIKEYQNWLIMLEPGFSRCFIRELAKSHFIALRFKVLTPAVYKYDYVVDRGIREQTVVVTVEDGVVTNVTTTGESSVLSKKQQNDAKMSVIEKIRDLAFDIYRKGSLRTTTSSNL